MVAVVVEAAQALEAQAMLKASANMTLSQAIQEGAVQQAVAALVTAEMIEEAAIEEAKQFVLAVLTMGSEGKGQEESA